MCFPDRSLLQPLGSVMYHRVLLAASLLSACSGKTSLNDPTETVYAFAGEDAVLPCSFTITSSEDFPTVEWSKQGLQPKVIFLYRDGCETYEEKNPAFHYRTSFITKEMKNRNISLRISNVQLSDAGKYRCMRLWKNAPRDITTVELVVGAVSEPKLSMVSAEGGGVTLLCEATCWLPEPEIQFLDDHGNNITADNPSRRQDASGCYTVTRSVTLQDATHRVTCSVHQPEINQTRVAQIHIPVDCMRPFSLPTGIAVGAAILLLLALSCGLAVFVNMRCRKSAKGPHLPMSRQSSDQSTVSTVIGSCENQPFLQSDEIGKLKREIVDLKSKLHEKEEIIHQLQNNNPPISPVVFQLGSTTKFFRLAASANSNHPEPGNVFQTQGPKPRLSRQNSIQEPVRPKQRNRINSSPAIFKFDDVVPSVLSSSNASKKKLGQIGRSKSDYFGCPDPKVPKPQRRHSSSSSPNNRYRPLAGLPEETELLISLEKNNI